jgi:hypothetical protein
MRKGAKELSFNLGLDNVKQFLVLALMLVFVFAVMFTSIALEFKITIGLLVFGMIFLTMMSDQASKQEEEQRKLSKA